MRGIIVFVIALIVAQASYDALFPTLEDPYRSLAAVGIGIMVTISFIKK